MQTKSPLVRIASVAGVALAIVALFVSLKHSAPRKFIPVHCQQSYGGLHPARDSALGLTKGKFCARLRQAAARVRGQSRTDGAGSSLPGARPELSIISDESGSGTHSAPDVSLGQEISERRVTARSARSSHAERRGKDFRSSHALRRSESRS